LKKLEDDIKERLYQEEMQRVKKVRDLHENLHSGCTNTSTHPKMLTCHII
jgi:hypothetical protein